MECKHVPVKHGTAERTSAARSPEEQVPDGVAECGRLGSGGEAGATGGTAERDRHDLALRLAGLNVRGDKGAVGQVCAGKERISSGTADLFQDVSKWQVRIITRYK